jgi:hypothetical protein
MRSSDRGPHVLSCMAHLAFIRLSLRLVGFGRTLTWYENAPRAQTDGNRIDEAVVQRVGHRLAIAVALFPGRARCLEQSMVLNRELRRRGADARLRFGVKPYPFSGHAWVEVAGKPIEEDSQFIDLITRLEN